MRKKRCCTKQPLSATIASPGHILLNIQVSKTFTKKCTFYIWPLPPPLPKKKIHLCTKASVQPSVYISNETRQAFMKLKEGDVFEGPDRICLGLPKLLLFSQNISISIIWLSSAIPGWMHFGEETNWILGSVLLFLECIFSIFLHQWFCKKDEIFIWNNLEVIPSSCVIV